MTVETLHEDQASVIPREVFFTGATALVRGQGLCYDRDYGTATDAEGKRDRCVELPTVSNNRAFAGVVARNYAALTGGRWITIYEPGSVCQVAVGVNTVVDTTIMTCSVGIDAGRFTFAGFPGRGTAIALETNASAVAGSAIDQSAALDATGKILTDASETFVTKGLVAGDKVVILAVEDDATNAGTPAIYTIASVDSETQLTLTAAASDGGTMEVTYYALHENPTVLAKLQDGLESGLVQVYEITDGANTGLMATGMTYIHGGFTPNADATETLADGTRIGDLKGFVLWGTLTTNDYLLTVTTGIQADGATTLASLEFDADTDGAILVWGPNAWCVLTLTGAGQA